MDKPLSAARLTQQEVDDLAVGGGTSRVFGWKFEEALFNGEWWALEIPKNRVSSAMNSYRNQCESVYGTRANVRRSRDGRLLVRRLVDMPKVPKPRKREVSEDE